MENENEQNQDLLPIQPAQPTQQNTFMNYLRKNIWGIIIVIVILGLLIWWLCSKKMKKKTNLNSNPVDLEFGGNKDIFNFKKIR